MADSEKLVVLGGGESGTGAALLGKTKGFDVFLSDKAALSEKYRAILDREHIRYEENGHTDEAVLAAGLVVKSPGIPDTSPLVRQVIARGIPVISEIELAARYTKARLIAITGSNGKTTTTLLTHHLLRQAGRSVGLAGNVGESLAKQVIRDDKEIYVIELSSFQLDNMYDFHADTAILLNITPDHLDRYNHDFSQYVDAKFRILQNQTPEDDFIFFRDNEPLASEVRKRPVRARQWPVSLTGAPSPGGFVRDGRLIVNSHGRTLSIPVAGLPLQGPHNAVNMLCAIIAANSAGLSPEEIESGLASFRNAPHRLEEVAYIDGVRYINDSKATNVDSVFYALRSFAGPVILILGGVDKGNDYGQIEALVREKVKGIIAMGKDNSKIEDFFAGTVPAFRSLGSLQEAVRAARGWAQPGDVVLLSPACASFDLFANYMDRGDQFREEVLKIRNC